MVITLTKFNTLDIRPKRLKPHVLFMHLTHQDSQKNLDLIKRN